MVNRHGMTSSCKGISAELTLNTPEYLDGTNGNLLDLQLQLPLEADLLAAFSWIATIFSNMEGHTNVFKYERISAGTRAHLCRSFQLSMAAVDSPWVLLAGKSRLAVGLHADPRYHVEVETYITASRCDCSSAQRTVHLQRPSPLSMAPRLTFCIDLPAAADLIAACP